MAEDAVVHIGENSPEQVAFKLLGLVANAEKQSLHGQSNTNREYIIRTYCMCLMAVKQYGYPDDALKVGGSKPS